MRAVAEPGRWVWGLTGLVTVLALTVSVVVLASAGSTPHQPPPVTLTRTVTLVQPVTGLTVQSYGGMVQVTAGSVRRVEVTETITYGPLAGGPPAVTELLSRGHLMLADPACLEFSFPCAVSFAVTVPPGVAVTAVTDGGALTVSGTGAADLDSGGAPVSAARIGGSLTVSTEGGPLLVDGLSGALRADTDGGSLTAQGVGAAAATVSTDGGNAQIAFSAPPQQVTLSTNGGLAALTVPGGPYALTADSAGGPQSVGIATDPSARSSITVSSGGGPVQIEP